jgi:hypothetical protein
MWHDQMTGSSRTIGDIEPNSSRGGICDAGRVRS